MKIRKLWVAMAATIAAASICAMFSPSASAQTTYAGPGPKPVFTDNLENGSSINTATGPGGTPTASYTSYNMNYDKGVGFTDSINPGPPGDLNMNLPNSSSAFGEAQAVFANSPVSLVTPGDYIDFILEFEDTMNIDGNSGGNANELNMGLYDANPVGGTPIEPIAGNVATVTALTGGTAAWTGYYSQILNQQGGTSSKVWYRPSQVGNTGSGNYTLTVNTGSIAGGFGNESTASFQAVQLINGSKSASAMPILNNGSLYTEDFRITLLSGNQLSVSNELFNGTGTGGTLVYALGGYTNATDMAFDGLAFSFANKGSSGVMTQDVSLVEVTDFIQVPEPSTWLLLASGLAVIVGLVSRRRRS